MIVIIHTFTNLVIYYNGTKKSRIHATTIEPFKRDYETTYPYQNADGVILMEILSMITTERDVMRILVD